MYNQYSPKYAQPDVVFPPQEYVINDNVNLHVKYPFNTHYTGYINELFIKADNTSIKLNIYNKDNNQYKIEADKDILFEIKGSSLYIWLAEHAEHKILTTKGQSIMEGYDVIKYDGTKIKTITPHGCPVWHTNNIELNKIEFRGEKSSLYFDSYVFTECGDINIKILGNNNVHIEESIFDSLSLFTTNSIIDFHGTKTKMADICIEGNSKVKGIECTDLIKCNIVGPSTVYIKISDECKTYEEIYGDGRVFYL